ncbi:MAG: hypothetical protein WCO23_04590 [bacterium]
MIEWLMRLTGTGNRLFNLLLMAITIAIAAAIWINGQAIFGSHLWIAWTAFHLIAGIIACFCKEWEFYEQYLLLQMVEVTIFVALGLLTWSAMLITGFKSGRMIWDRSTDQQSIPWFDSNELDDQYYIDQM